MNRTTRAAAPSASAFPSSKTQRRCSLTPRTTGIAVAGAARAAGTVRDALDWARTQPPGRVLVCGSLYLAGEVLKLDGTLPA